MRRWTNLRKGLACGVLAFMAALCGVPSSADDGAIPPLRFRPKKGNFADPIPLFSRGEYHVFYLRGGEPKVPWEHIASKDLTTWRELPTALVADGKPDSPDGQHMFTGSVIEHDGAYHLFYTGWNPANPAGREFVMHATSPDLVAWTKHPELGFPPDGHHYAKKQDSDFRDPFVFRNEADGRWWMLLCARAGSDNRPVTGVYTSADLLKWEPRAPLCDGYRATPECPDLFRMGDTYYLITSPSEGVTTYRTANSLDGPWSPAPGKPIDTPILYAAKSQSDGRRRVLTGWLRDLEGNKDGGNFQWGGDQSIPRELFAGPDGSLLSRPAPELRALYTKTVLDLASARPTPLDAEGRPTADPGRWGRDGAAIVAESPGLTRARLAGIPADYHLDMAVTLTGPDATFALALRQGEAPAAHYRLEVRPSRNETTLAGPGSDYPRPVPFAPGEEVRIEAFVDGSLIECFINGGHAFSGRAYTFKAGDLDLLVTGGKAKICALTVKVREPK